MLSEYHRDPTSSGHSDFYRFLYNRSKMKSLSKYFSTKTESSTTKTTSASCTKDTLIMSNRDSLVSNKGAENKRYFYSRTKEEEAAEEEKILNWLVSYDSDNDDNVKPETEKESLRGEATKNNAEKTNNSRDARENRPANNALDAGNQKQWLMRTIEDEISNSSGDKMISTNSQEAIIQPLQVTAKKIKSVQSLLKDTTELHDNESLKIIKDYLPESRPLRSPMKRTGQRKISEFFQRTL